MEPLRHTVGFAFTFAAFAFRQLSNSPDWKVQGLLNANYANLGESNRVHRRPIASARCELVWSCRRFNKDGGPQADPWKPYAAWLDSPKFAAFAYKKL